MKFTNFLFVLAFVFTSLVRAQETYSIGNTEYYYNETYSTTGKPKVKRSAANKRHFLQNMGYEHTPEGYEIDHIIPLSQGGSDDPSNMQLLTVDQHKAKTARERAGSSFFSGLPTFSSYSSTTIPSSYYSSNSTSSFDKTYYTGSNGGTYYYNSNGNKTYVKKKSYTSTNTSSYSISPPYNSSSSRTLHTGSRGGTYYINSNGNKTYVKKN
ncbi:HNH endonuclease signature motif containing protein [Maribacter sp. HS]|uniref:HNH endonuclease signature motif containing protein n=1 Tax=Maribacter sp. HS TaxID=3110480 RepID=UPI003A8B22E6